MRLLELILDALLPPRASSMLVRNTNDQTLATRVSPTHFSHDQGTVTALLPYRDELVRACILEAKFHGNAHASAVLGAILGTYLRAHEPGTLILVPVPLGEKRQRARGYNQVERICTAALPHLGDSAQLSSTILIRTRETLPQTELSGTARRENVREAFSATVPSEQDCTYVVVDDVTTTGATLRAACNALRAAGVRNLVALAIAY